MTARPKVSIGLPVYNGEDYLPEALDSILAQTFPDFELVICDNASSDGTEEICRDYAARDSRIRYHRQSENIGGAANHNMAFDMARGQYFRWASHDDLLAPTLLERCVAVLDADPGCVLVHPATVLIDAEGRETECYIDLIALDSEDPVARFARWMDPPHGLCNPLFGLMRPEVVATTGLHGNYPSSDRVFLGEMALRGRCRIVKEGLFLRRIHPLNSVVANPDPRDLFAWFSGGRRRRLTFKTNRLLGGFLASVHRAPLTFPQRLRAYGVVLKWLRAYWKPMVKEWMVPFYMNGRATPLTLWIRRLLRGTGQQQTRR